MSPKKVVISDKFIKEYSLLKKISSKKKLRLIEIGKIKEKLINYKKLKPFNDFQIKNLSMAIEAAKLCKLKEKKIFSVLNKLKDVNGRYELVRSFPNNIKVYVDFAYTPDALLKTLNTLRQTYGFNVSLVFGCGGIGIKKRDH